MIKAGEKYHRKFQLTIMAMVLVFVGFLYTAVFAVANDVFTVFCKWIGAVLLIGVGGNAVATFGNNTSIQLGRKRE